MTLDGEISAEHLSVGGRVITRDSGMSVIKTIHTRDVKMQPIRIKAGSLGHTRPDRDMMIAPRRPHSHPRLACRGAVSRRNRHSRGTPPFRW